MQVVKNSLIILLILPILIVFFMPKKELYYLLEQKLKAENIVISGEVLVEGPLSLTVEHPVFFLGGAPVASAKKITLWSILFYSKASTEALLLAEGLAEEVSVAELKASHSLLSPWKVSLSGKGSLGEMKGELMLKERQIHLSLSKGGENKALSKYLKKDKKGGWQYESKF